MSNLGNYLKTKAKQKWCPVSCVVPALQVTRRDARREEKNGEVQASVRSAESPRHFSSAEHISLFWSSFIRGEIRGLSWERKSCFLRGLSLLRLCVSRQLSDLLMVLVLEVGAAGSQESLKRGTGVWGKERSDYASLYNPRHGADRHWAKSSEIPLGEADSLGKRRWVYSALPVHCRRQVRCAKSGRDLKFLRRKSPSLLICCTLLHLSNTSSCFSLICLAPWALPAPTTWQCCLQNSTRSQIRITGGRAWRQCRENRVGAVFTVWRSFEVRSHFVAQTSFPPFCLSLLRTRIMYDKLILQVRFYSKHTGNNNK